MYVLLKRKKSKKNNNNKNRRAYIELNQFEVVCNVNVFRNYLCSNKTHAQTPSYIYICVYLIQNLCFNLLFKNFVELNLLYVYIHKIMNNKKKKKTLHK